MNCEQYLEQAFRRSAETGAGAQADSISEHLLTCQDCLQASPVLKQFHQHEAIQTPLRFLEDILSKVEQNKTTIECLDCEHAEEELSAFIDGELSDEREEQIIIHLADCDECTLALSELKGLSGTLGRSYAQSMPIPADFAAMVTRAAFSDEKADSVGPVLTGNAPSNSSVQPMKIGPRPPFKAWLSAAAAVLVTASLGIVMLNNNSNPQNVESEMAKAARSYDQA
ncbi:MAG: zf-HC2 domain-containing protein, partial [Planctomycetota bacterium]|nr:zf-HC2 domain-containing protein [Planctomycetota bacterium]